MISNLWYAESLGIERLTASGWSESPKLWRAALNSDLIVTKLHRDTFPLVAFEGLLGRRRLVLMELQHTPISGWRAGVVRLWRPLLRRSVAAAQVLSSWEVDACAERLGIPRERIRFIPWALPEVDPGPARRAAYVLASGHAACDWETLFTAAELASWPLTVVCGQRDARRVAKLNAGGRATVLVDIPRGEHSRLVKHASVYVLPLLELSVSSGQIRLMEAVSKMTPVVATGVRGLVDYLDPGVSALVVDPGDALSLRAAIDRILMDEALGRRLTEGALEMFVDRSMENYLNQVRELVANANEGLRQLAARQ